MKDAAARSALRSPDAFVPFELARCDQPIHRAFEGHAACRPRAVAVRLATVDVSYASLNADANRTVRALLAVAGASAQPVALLLDQGYASIVWTLAILKAGRAYAPLDQRLPEPVLQAMLTELAPSALIAAPAYHRLAAALAADLCPVIDTGDVANAVTRRRFGADIPIAGDAGTNLDLPVAANSLAYVFYTSGSTGAPKGVADCHRNVLHNVLRYTNSLRFAPGDVFSLVQNPSFSGTVSTLFGALANGAAVAPHDLNGEGLQQLSAYVKRAEVTVFHAVPSLFRQLSDPVERFPRVRLIRLEGDRSTAADLLHFHANFHDSCTLVNGLGATECGLVRQFFIDRRRAPEDPQLLPIGYPVRDMCVRVVDDESRTLPAGSIGEIVVESRYLASGYWCNPAMTQQRFTDLGHGVRRYRTGDLGRMDADGCLAHLGRVDHGIRIGGEFVDPSAVEHCLLAIPGVKQCVVRDYVDGAQERRLCAYVVAEQAGELSVDRLRAALADRVGWRLVPTAFVFLAALPLSKDLKVDAKRLPNPGRERPPLPNDLVPPVNDLEHLLARIWCEVLEIDAIGVTDSFFDLGGDSLRAAQVVTRLRERHGQTIHVAALFERSTIRALAAALECRTPPH